MNSDSPVRSPTEHDDFFAIAERPRIHEEKLRDFSRRKYGVDIAEIRDLGSYVDQNLHIIDSAGRESLLKVHDAREHAAVLDLQNRVMQHLGAAVEGIDFPRPFKSLDGHEIESIEDQDGRVHLVRMLSYVRGTLLNQLSPVPESLLRHVGHTAGQMDRALRSFYHPAANRPDIPWDLKNASHTGRLSRYIECPDRRRVTDFFLLKFDNEVRPILGGLRKSVVHGDMHRSSVLLDEQCQGLSGVIDFGDVVYTHTACNLAVCLSDMVVAQPDPIEAATLVVEAYHREFPLSETELGVLFPLMSTRLAIYMCMAAYSRNKDPQNAHAGSKEDDVWSLMERLVAINPIHAEENFRLACNFPSLLPSHRDKAASDILKREEYFARSLYTHYREPLHLTGGALQYLHDDKGNSYLDCVNNVCQWGHCHPRIVRATQRQLSRLNTNSRYVYSLKTDYAERLLDTLPDPLNVVFLVNSGSEANDLALRLARAYTDRRDVMVVDRAYHGNSTACTEMSPQRVDRPGKPGLGDYVHKCVVPDTFRGEYGREDLRAGEKYAEHVRTVAEELDGRGTGIAAFIAESMIGTGGQIVLPENYLHCVYRHVRSAGGVCIADEVQMGFGRVGSHVWCFETQGVVPDIVTMGKPIGNGHPMAAVVTTREIAEAYDQAGVTYFNTFGGNPVSCATGLAVLEVLQEENLLENTRHMSRLLFDGLKSLQDRYPVIADVRGLGLYIGMELVKDRTTLEPATQLANTVVEAMKARGILLNTNGYDNNIIKIKPPLIIGRRDVARLLDGFAEVFNNLS